MWMRSGKMDEKNIRPDRAEKSIGFALQTCIGAVTAKSKNAYLIKYQNHIYIYQFDRT